MHNKIVFVNTISSNLGTDCKITIEPIIPKVIVSPWM